MGKRLTAEGVEPLLPTGLASSGFVGKCTGKGTWAVRQSLRLQLPPSDASGRPRGCWQHQVLTPE